MTKIFTYCFDKWWRPLLFWAFAVTLFIAGELTQNSSFGNISYMLLGISLLVLIVSIIYQLSKKRWFNAILTGLVFGGTIGLYILYGLLLFFIETMDGDKWADNLKIPPNIQLDTPINLTLSYERQDSVLAWKKSKTDLQLYNASQPGMYEFDFWTGKIESGTIHLKAFEITQEYALSADRLAESSTLKIYNPTDSIRKFSKTGHFTIYEGDWGKPYAARFEVWYKPDNGGEEQKLYQKNYKIEGWMR